MAGDVVYAPWTPGQVLSLTAYQRGPAASLEEMSRGKPGKMHPFTCANRGDRDHGEHPILDGDNGVLVPTVWGWICPFCDYTQDWAHRFMVEWPVE